MRALILPDRDIVTRERALLERLEVGLADEGYRVLHALPAAVSGGSPESINVFSTLLRYADRGLPMTRGLRVGALIDSIRTIVSNEDMGLGVNAPAITATRLVDVVHALGVGGWTFALALARRTGSTLVLDVWEAGLVHMAARVGATAVGVGVRVVCLCGDEPLAAALRRELGASKVGVAVAPWGVHLPAPRAWLPAADRSIGVVLLASGQQPASVRAAMAGVAGASSAAGEVLLFVDASLARAVPISRWAEELGLGGRMSLIPSLEAQRELTTGADVLLLPEATGHQHTLALEAMACGMAVVATPDPMVSWLIDGTTARLAAASGGGASEASWTAAISSVLRETDATAALVLSARRYVGEHRLASRYVRDVLAAYAE